jgi:hypothetical protein
VRASRQKNSDSLKRADRLPHLMGDAQEIS